MKKLSVEEINFFDHFVSELIRIYPDREMRIKWEADCHSLQLKVAALDCRIEVYSGAIKCFAPWYAYGKSPQDAGITLFNGSIKAPHSGRIEFSVEWLNLRLSIFDEYHTLLSMLDSLMDGAIRRAIAMEVEAKKETLANEANVLEQARAAWS